MAIPSASSQPVAPPPPLPSRLKGRIDAIDGRHLFGWVYDEAYLGDRVVAEVVLDGVSMAKAVADRPRVDLRRNGIGDGHHAFDVALSDELLAARERIEVVAVSPSTGARTPLRLPAAPELAAEAAIATPLAGILDKLELLVATQRKLVLSQRDLLRGQATNETASLADRSGEIEAVLATARVARDEAAARFDTLDLFLVRFDTTLAGLDTRIEHLSRDLAASVRRTLAIVSLAAAMSTAAALVCAGSLLLLRH